MPRLSTLIFCTLAASSSLFGPAAGLIQKRGLTQSATSAKRADAVKSAFTQAYKDYLKYGYPDDEVLPLSKGSENTRNGWRASLVDSLTTLFVMDLKREFDDGVKKTLTIDFTRSQTDDTVSVFETTIRYLGGMLSAYELSGSQNKALLKQAVTLGDKLSFAWLNSNQTIPYNQLNFTSNEPLLLFNSIAGAGTLIIEFDRLSTFSGNDTYRQLAQRTEQQFMNGPQVFPGLPPQFFDPQTAEPANDYVSWGASSDSYFEYLNKYALLTGTKHLDYLRSWRSAVGSSIDQLLTKSSVGSHTYLADYSASSGGKQYRFSHLACFVGGNWLLGAKMLDDQSIYKYGLELVDSCMNSYTSTATGIGPETFGFIGPDGLFTGNEPSADDLAFYAKHGFFINDSRYILRPEVIESAFYAWRITGDVKYQDFVWNAFQALLKYSKAPASFASLSDVNNQTASRDDNCESFLYAETFKYLYLTFSSPSLMSLDEVVFTTEAHPFRYNSPRSPYSIKYGKYGTKQRYLEGKKKGGRN